MTKLSLEAAVPFSFCFCCLVLRAWFLGVGGFRGMVVAAYECGCGGYAAFAYPC